MKYFSDMNDAVSVLENITSSVEPIQRLMRTLEENTKLFDIQPKDEEAQKELLKQPKYRMVLQLILRLLI